MENTIPIRIETINEIDQLIKKTPLALSINAYKMLEQDLAAHAKSIKEKEEKPE